MTDTVARDVAKPFDVLAAARDLHSAIVAAREEAEAQRRTPAPLAKAITDAGLYQMFLPKSLGGPELDPLTAFRAIEELSRADGSVGWCAMIATDVSLIAGWLPPEAARVMCGAPPDLRVAGSLRPQGRAWQTDGGYRVKGRWDFASGIDNANWLYCTCVLMDDDKPRLTPAGGPAVRAMWLPIDQAKVIDTWSTIGMRGTGSQDFEIEDRFVPADRTSFLGEKPFATGPLYNPRAALALLWVISAGNALGIARGAIDDFILLAAREASTQSTVPLRDRPAVQSRVAEAEAILNAARAYVVGAVADLWAALVAAAPDPAREILHARLAITHGIHEAVRAVDIVFHTAGTNAIHTKNPLERHFRDIHVAVQHNAAFRAHYESAGKVILGRRPADPGW